MLGVRLPRAVIEVIDRDVETGLYLNRSDWIRIACREYAEKRKRDGAGGGALINPSAPAPARASAGGGAVALLSIV